MQRLDFFLFCTRSAFSENLYKNVLSLSLNASFDQKVLFCSIQFLSMDIYKCRFLGCYVSSVEYGMNNLNYTSIIIEFFQRLKILKKTTGKVTTFAVLNLIGTKKQQPKTFQASWYNREKVNHINEAFRRLCKFA